MLFVAFGATVLVPILIGIDPAVALFTAGVGTLLFHFVTGGVVPVFLGSSFVFIAPIIAATALYGISGTFGSFIVIGILFLLISLIIRKKGITVIQKLFPPIVIGPVIMTIGLSLANVGVSMSTSDWLLSLFTLFAAVVIVIFGKKTIKLLPIIGSVLIAYLFAIVLKRVDFSPLFSANWFSIPQFITPSFSLGAILFMLPIAIAPLIEHIGDIYAIGRATGKDYVKKPGIHKTIFGDGLAILFGGVVGGPPVTTYSEVTGAIVLTKLKNPQILRISAIFAIIIAFIGKISGFLQTIPEAILGGTMLLLFGMISVVGIKTLLDSKTNLNNTKNMVIVAIMLTIGVGGAMITYGNFSLGGVGLAAVIGVILNLILPNK
jgi:uracil permease